MTYSPLQSLSYGLAGHADRVSWSSLSSRDWNLLVSTAEEEGVAALLCRGLDETGWLDRIPEHARLSLQRARFATAANNLLMYDELCRILDALDCEAPATSRPTAVVLKGADLAMTVYPSIALRPMCDLDLLVPRQVLDGAVRRMQELGYQETIPEVASGHNRLTGHALTLSGRPRRVVSVELHWGLVAGDSDWRSPVLDWFWEQTEEWQRGVTVSAEMNGNVKTNLPSSFFHLRPAAHLLYLAAHLMFQHGGDESRLVWFYDIHLLVSRYQSHMDWNEIQRRAREFQWTAPLHAALKGTRDRFDTPLPGGFLEAVAKDADRESARVVQNTSEPIQPRGPRIWNEMMCLSRPARLRFVRNHFFPGAAYMIWRYNPRPKWLWPLCYPYRWGVILSEGLFALGRWTGWSRVREGSP